MMPSVLDTPMLAYGPVVVVMFPIRYSADACPDQMAPHKERTNKIEAKYVLITPPFSEILTSAP